MHAAEPTGVFERISQLGNNHLPLMRSLLQRWSNATVLPADWASPIYAFPWIRRTKKLQRSTAGRVPVETPAERDAGVVTRVAVRRQEQHVRHEEGSREQTGTPQIAAEHTNWTGEVESKASNPGTLTDDGAAAAGRVRNSVGRSRNEALLLRKPLRESTPSSSPPSRNDAFGAPPNAGSSFLASPQPDPLSETPSHAVSASPASLHPAVEEAPEQNAIQSSSVPGSTAELRVQGSPASLGIHLSPLSAVKSSTQALAKHEAAAASETPGRHTTEPGPAGSPELVRGAPAQPQAVTRARSVIGSHRSPLLMTSRKTMLHRMRSGRLTGVPGWPSQTIIAGAQPVGSATEAVDSGSALPARLAASTLPVGEVHVPDRSISNDEVGEESTVFHSSTIMPNTAPQSSPGTMPGSALVYSDSGAAPQHSARASSLLRSHLAAGSQQAADHKSGNPSHDDPAAFRREGDSRQVSSQPPIIARSPIIQRLPRGYKTPAPTSDSTSTAAASVQPLRTAAEPVHRNPIANVGMIDLQSETASKSAGANASMQHSAPMLQGADHRENTSSVTTDHKPGNQSAAPDQHQLNPPKVTPPILRAPDRKFTRAEARGVTPDIIPVHLQSFRPTARTDQPVQDHSVQERAPHEYTGPFEMTSAGSDGFPPSPIWQVVSPGVTRVARIPLSRAGEMTFAAGARLSRQQSPASDVSRVMALFNPASRPSRLTTPEHFTSQSPVGLVSAGGTHSRQSDLSESRRPLTHIQGGSATLLTRQVSGAAQGGFSYPNRTDTGPSVAPHRSASSLPDRRDSFTYLTTNSTDTIARQVDAIEPRPTKSSPVENAGSVSTTGGLDVRRVADQVYQLITRRLASERERRGL